MGKQKKINCHTGKDRANLPFLAPAISEKIRNHIGSDFKFTESFAPKAQSREVWGALADALITEWSISHAITTKVKDFLKDIKGLSDPQITYIMKIRPFHLWKENHEKISVTVSQMVADKHAKLIVEASERHISASNLVTARAMELLAKFRVTDLEEAVLIEGPDGKKRTRFRKSIRAIDLVNCANAIKIAQEVIRKALGIQDHDEAGLKQVLEAVRLGQTNIQNNLSVTINSGVQPTNESEKKLAELPYDDIVRLIELKREHEKQKGLSDDDA